MLSRTLEAIKRSVRNHITFVKKIRPDLSNDMVIQGTAMTFVVKAIRSTTVGIVDLLVPIADGYSNSSKDYKTWEKH